MPLLDLLLPVRFRHWRRFVSPYYRNRQREIKRLRSLPRYKPTCTRLLGKPLQLIDAASFVSAYTQIFERGAYDFSSEGGAPNILDCGANIGLSTLYWKQVYPSAQITAFEPDPGAFRALVWNCEQWQVTGVKLVDKAVWNANEELPFWVEGADGGHLVADSKAQSVNNIVVSAVRLRDYLACHIDLLKLDIEGAETEVLIDCSDRLEQVDHIFVEYHSFVGREQRIDDILRILRAAGFRVHIQPELVSPKPFVKRLNDNGMDHRLNVFAYRK